MMRLGPRPWGARRVRAWRTARTRRPLTLALLLAVSLHAGPVMAEPTDEPAVTAPAVTTSAPADEPTPTPPAGDDTSPPAAPTPTPAVTAPSPAASPAVTSPPGLENAPPAVTITTQSPFSWAIAGVALLASLAVLALLGRRNRTAWPADAGTHPTPRVTTPSDPAARLAALEATGEAMIDAGYSVTTVRAVLEDMARVNGFPSAEIVVLPTALFVSIRGVGDVRTGAVSSGHSRLNLGQIDDLDDVVTDVRRAPSEPGEVVRRIGEVRASRSPYSVPQRVVAYGFLSGAISVMLGASWGGVGVAAFLGLLVGVALQLSERVTQQFQALVTVALSFGVATVVLTLTTLGIDPGVLPSLIAPLVILLPGGLLTTGVIELATGQMIAGAGRLAAGFMQLVLLAIGVVGGAALVGVPQLELSGSSQPLGPLGPWLAVAVFGTAIVVHQSGRRQSIGWTLLVLYVAYGAQVIGDIFFGGVLSAFIGAFAMTPVAALVSRFRAGPAEFVSFLPGFWLLVPGALGLVGVASILDGDSAGLTTLVTTTSTMVAIALGILSGMAISSRWEPSRLR